MPPSGRVPVQFERPPLVEVSCGIAFSLPNPLKTAHVGLFWSLVRDQFPVAEEATPLPMTVENTGADGPVAIEFELSNNVPLRRSWLINNAGTHLIQLQEDRLLFNWKRTESAPEYPRYVNVIAGFRDHWATFKAFLLENEIGEPNVKQLEMTYVNIIDYDLLPTLFVDRATAPPPSRFLPKEESMDWRSNYRLPEAAGRLHTRAITARHSKTGAQVVRFDLTARGLPNDLSESGCTGWFDLAHEWITHGFADLTTPAAQKVWGRIS